MSDERLGRLAGAWLRETLPPPRDSKGSVARAMASAGRTPQLRPSRLPAFLARDPDRLTDAARSEEGSRPGADRTLHDSRKPQGGSIRMAIATAASFWPGASKSVSASCVICS